MSNDSNTPPSRDGEAAGAPPAAIPHVVLDPVTALISDGRPAELSDAIPQLTDESDTSNEVLVGYGQDILVVDDNAANLLAIEAALEPLGRRMVLVRSGVEALSMLLKQDFALILLDVQMPEMDGFETARLMRSRERKNTEW